ncbi:MAG: AbrB/MazE/SpoVT family DNA-binding domain-containing protein, partial [Candidatus Hodarchaeota archaeon]
MEDRRVEARKIQRAGYSSLSVSLPIDWAKEVKLKQGDTVFFTREKDNSLNLKLSDQLMSEADTKEFVINSDLCNEKRMLERIIVGNYVIGRDMLRITSSKRIRSAHIEETR